jgi:hypothetical protein
VCPDEVLTPRQTQQSAQRNPALAFVQLTIGIARTGVMANVQRSDCAIEVVLMRPSHRLSLLFLSPARRARQH